MGATGKTSRGIPIFRPDDTTGWLDGFNPAMEAINKLFADVFKLLGNVGDENETLQTTITEIQAKLIELSGLISSNSTDIEHLQNDVTTASGAAANAVTQADAALAAANSANDTAGEAINTATTAETTANAAQRTATTASTTASNADRKATVRTINVSVDGTTSPAYVSDSRILIENFTTNFTDEFHVEITSSDVALNSYFTHTEIGTSVGLLLDHMGGHAYSVTLTSKTFTNNGITVDISNIVAALDSGYSLILFPSM